MRRFLMTLCTLAFAVAIAPQESQAQSPPFECEYCFGVAGYGVCVDQIQSIPCNEGSAPDPNGCSTCSTGGDDLDLEVSLRYDGSLWAPGTAFDGVDPGWLEFVADDRGGVFVVEAFCGAEISLHVEATVLAGDR